MEKKNGKGTEYLDGNYIFKGEFKNGNIYLKVKDMIEKNLQKN